MARKKAWMGSSMKSNISWAVTLLLAFAASPSYADTFGTGPNSFEIELVTIGSPGNPPDNPNPAGAVPYIYRMGKYEISEQMIDKANALGGLGITKDARGPDKPATSITWFEAAQFVNWLNTSSGSVPAYKFDASGNFQLWQPVDPGYDPGNLYRNRLATYFLPSVHEWHKAAYYDPVAGHYWDYPTGSDAVPDGIDWPGDPNFDAVFYEGATDGGPNEITDAGLPGPYGTLAQGGNAAEWVETAFSWTNVSPLESRSILGGGWGDGPNSLAAWNSNGSAPWDEAIIRGFRIASIAIPEPTGLTLFALVAMMLGVMRMRTRNA